MRRTPSSLLLGAAVLSLCHGAVARAQTADSDQLDELRAQVEALKKGQEEIRKELLEIRSLLQGRQGRQPTTPVNAVMDLSGVPFKGDERAPVTMIEYMDYQ